MRLIRLFTTMLLSKSSSSSSSSSSGSRPVLLRAMHRHSHTTHTQPVDVREARKESAFATSITVGNKHRISSDLKTDERGVDDGPSPKELLLSALGSCTAMTIRTFYENSRANTSQKWGELRRIAVVLHEVPSDDHPHVPRGIDLQVSLDGDLTQAQMDRLLRAASNCPVKQMLSGRLEIACSLK